TAAATLDYNAASATVTIDVNKATLTVQAQDADRVYGTANPAFAVSYSGFVNGEDLSTSGVSGSPILTTMATASSAPGTYPITVGVGTLTAGNYAFNLVSGTLTVTPAPLAAAGVNFSATAGAPFSGAVATFTNADPFGTAASYAAT